MQTEACAARHHERGFSIIEALLAIVMLLLAVLAMLAIIPASFGGTSLDSERIQAVEAGQQYLDSLRQYIRANGTITGLPLPPSITIDAGDSYRSGAALASPGNFTMSPNCQTVSGTSKLFDCVVTVTWTQNNAGRTVKVETYVASQKP